MFHVQCPTGLGWAVEYKMKKTGHKQKGYRSVLYISLPCKLPLD